MSFCKLMSFRGFKTISKVCQAKILDGRKMADEVLLEVKGEVEEWVGQGHRRPHLTAILVGEDPPSKTYVKHKMVAAAFTGISSTTIKFNANIEEHRLCEEIHKLNTDSEVDGILIQLPLPACIDERRVCNMVAPEKDVDGFHIVNVGRACVNQDSLIPATPAGVIEMLKRAGIKTMSKRVVVVGRSKNVGMPIAMLLHSNGGNATTTICHRYTPHDDLKRATLNADIIIVATGTPNLITADMVTEGCVVVDVGVNQVFEPFQGRVRLVGDVSFEEVSKKASVITPVPGGVGPLTVAMLMKNTLRVARREISYDHCWGIDHLTPHLPSKKSSLAPDKIFSASKKPLKL